MTETNETKNKTEKKPKINVEYAENTKESRLSNIFKFDYINEHLKIEFGQVQNVTDEEINITVISNIIIPKDIIEIFIGGLTDKAIQLQDNNEIKFNFLKIKENNDNYEDNSKEEE